MLAWLADVALALGALASFLVVGVAAVKWLRLPVAGLERVAFGAGAGVLLHALAGLAVALSPAKQATALCLFIALWAAAAWTFSRPCDTDGSVQPSVGRCRNGVGPALTILAGFIVLCGSATHLQIVFPRVLPDGMFIFKEHSLPVKVQVMAGNLPVDNYLPFVVEEFLLRDISFVREHPIIPGQEVSNRPILMALAAAPFRAAINPPPRQKTALGRFSYVDADWPDVRVFLEGPGFRQFLAIGIVLNALALLGAALLIVEHGPRFLLAPGLLLLATSPFCFSQTIFTWPKSLAAFYLLLALHTLARGKSPVWVAVAGTLAYYSHPYAVVFLFGFGCHYAAIALWKRGRPEVEEMMRYGVAAALTLAPWFIWTKLILRLPSDLVSQNIAGHGVDSVAAHIWIRIVNLHQALAAGMLSGYPFRAETVFRGALVCLPGILGLLALPAYAGCAACLRTHRVFVVQGIMLPALLLSLPFSRPAPLTMLAYHAIGPCLLLLGLIVIARAPRGVAIGLTAAQIVLNLGFLFIYGQALGARWEGSDGVVYRLLDHQPEVRDARLKINFHVDIGIGEDHAEAIWSEPPASLVYRRIRLPAGSTHFRCRIAIHPQVWAEGGADGAEFVLAVRPSGATDPNDRGREIWRAVADPFHHPEQRAWLPVDVDLSEFADKTVDLILRNNAGPANNDYADWCVWADPELVPGTQ